MPRKPRQRGRPGDGSVYQRAGGKWIAALSIGGRENRRYITRVAPTESAATEALRRLRAENSILSALDDEPTQLDAYLKRWLAGQQSRLKNKTWVGYESTLRLHVMEKSIGFMRIDRIKPKHIAALFAELQAGNVASRSRELVYLRLRSAFAVIVGRVIAANPVRPEHRPRVPRRTMTVWDQSQVRQFLKATAQDRLGALYRLALSVGMRRGELLGLQWRDVNLKERRLSIQHTLTEAGKLTEAKTSGSRRLIRLPDGAVQALAAQKTVILAQGLRASPWVFPNVDGGPLLARNVSSTFNAAVAATDLPRIRFHDLRHTAATLHLGAGTHPKVVSELLGHASIAVTLDLYSHVLESVSSGAAATMDLILGDGTVTV